MGSHTFAGHAPDRCQLQGPRKGERRRCDPSLHDHNLGYSREAQVVSFLLFFGAGSADAAISYTCRTQRGLSVYVCALLYGSAVQTRLNRSRCRLGGANYYASRKPYVKRVGYTYGDCDVISFNIYASRIVSFSYRKFLGVMGSVKHKV